MKGEWRRECEAFPQGGLDWIERGWKLVLQFLSSVGGSSTLVSPRKSQEHDLGWSPRVVVSSLDLPYPSGSICIEGAKQSTREVP